MEITKNLKTHKNNILTITIIALAVILSIAVMSNSSRSISVTGSAERRVKSDYVVWGCSFQRQEKNLVKAYKKLEEDLKKVKAYLAANGVAEKEIAVSPVYADRLYKKDEIGLGTNEIDAYLLCQSIEIRSSQVDKVIDISSDVAKLIKEGIELEAGVPEYFCTKKEALKTELYAEAAQNAKEIAEHVLKTTGNKIRVLRFTEMDNIRILPLNSSTAPECEEDDTTSLNKKIVAYVSASFSIK